MNASDPANIAAFSPQLEVMETIALVSCFDVAAVVILAYDYLLTFSLELNYIWRRSVTPITLLFFFVRYMPFIDTTLLLIHENLPINHVITFGTIFKTQVWLYGVGLLCAHIILILRTCAIWGNESRIAIGLGTLLLVFALSGGYFVARYNASLQFSKNPFSVAPAYIVTRVDTLIFVPYVTFVAFETVVLVLTLWKVKQQRGGSIINRVLYRDCVLFYLLLLAISLVNIGLLISETGVQKLLVTQLHRILHSVVLGRVVLNIREAMDNQESEDDHLLTLLYGDGTLINIPETCLLE